jgi:hypothetical protein
VVSDMVLVVVDWGRDGGIDCVDTYSKIYAYPARTPSTSPLYINVHSFGSRRIFTKTRNQFLDILGDISRSMKMSTANIICKIVILQLSTDTKIDFHPRVHFVIVSYEHR